MSQLADDILNKLADVFDEAAVTCEQARKSYDEFELKRVLYGAYNLLDITLDVMEDEIKSLDQDTLGFLAWVTKRLVEQPSFEKGMFELMEQVNGHLKTEALSIFMLDEPKEELVVKYAAGPVSQKVFGLRMPVGKGVVGWVVKHEETLIVPSANLDARFFSGIDAQTGFITRSILCVPIARHNQVIGAIEVLNKTTGDFHDEDVKLLEGVSNVIANCLTGVC